MEEFLPLVLQGGALLILAYLVFWVTKELAPRLIDALLGIKTAMEQNTAKLDRMEQTNNKLVEVVVAMAREAKTIGEETLTTIKKQNEQDQDHHSDASK